MASNRVIDADNNIIIKGLQWPSSDGSVNQVIQTDGSGTLTFADQTGGGGTGINHITNPNAETDTAGYASYADAAATTPADGTGGSANVAISRNTSSPLRNTADFKIEKDAVNRQGQGVSNDFTVDAADKAKKLIISFDYDASHAGYADDDIKIFIYDVTNTNLIRVSNEELKAGKGTHYSQFQTASDSTSYRLIFHVASTNAAAYDVFLDEVSVGPRDITHGAIVSDWESWTPTGTWSSNTTYTGFKKRIGDTGYYIANIATSGAPTSADLNINMPSGEVIDTSKLTSTFSQTHLGRLSIRDSSESDPDDSIDGKVFYQSTSAVSLQHLKNSSNNEGNDNITQASPITFGSGDIIVASWSAPIVGYSSNAKMSEEFSGREVKLIASGNSGSALSANTERIDWTTTTDSTGSFSTTDNGTDTFTCPESGTYAVDGVCALTSGTAAGQSVRAFVNNVANIFVHISPSSTTTRYKKINGMLALEKGDTLDFRLDATGTIENSATIHWLHIQKIASPQTILENETVAARYTLSTADAIGTGDTDVVFDEKDYDTHNALSSGVYTAPVTGYYKVNIKVHGEAEAYAASGYLDVILFVDRGAGYAIHERSLEKSFAGTNSLQARLDTQIYLSKGDLVKVTAKSTVATNVLAAAQFNSFCISRMK